MELTEVLRRRRMVRRYTRTSRCGPPPWRPCSPPRSGRRRPGSPRGSRCLVLDTPEEPGRLLGRDGGAGRGRATAQRVARRDADRSCPGPGLDRARPRTSTVTPSPTRGGPTATSERWSAPYWFVDAGMAAMAALLRGGRRRPGRLLLRRPVRPGGRGARRVRGAGGPAERRRGEPRAPARPTPRPAGRRRDGPASRPSSWCTGAVGRRPSRGPAHRADFARVAASVILSLPFGLALLLRPDVEVPLEDHPQECCAQDHPRRRRWQRPWPWSGPPWAGPP